MRSSVFGVVLIGLVAAGVAACGGRKEPPGPPRAEEWHAPISILRHFAGPDGLTRKQLEDGLRRDFNAADSNHDGVLQPDEMRVVNQQRWVEDQSAISPLQDWNGDGVIDFNEFAATARALFNEADRDGNGVITAEELRMKKPGSEAAPAKGDPEQAGQPRKRRGGQPQGGGPGG